MKTISDYWKDFAVRWEESSYDRRMDGLSLVERVATRQREHILARRQTALRFLAPRIAGRRVLEIGCGGGALALDLARHGAAHVTGIDISPDVIQIATAKARDAGLSGTVEFLAGSIETLPADRIGTVDVLTGLGILEYLNPETTARLIASVRPTALFLSFDERRLTTKTALHFVYRRLKRFPYYRKYGAQELQALLRTAGVPQSSIVREGDNTFVTTFELNR
jgi:2-polyprenyl-3-methyl-5-hydroxy-6-metoxy-1,4-benzoquinol methylase